MHIGCLWLCMGVGKAGGRGGTGARFLAIAGQPGQFKAGVSYFAINLHYNSNLTLMFSLMLYVLSSLVYLFHKKIEILLFIIIYLNGHKKLHQLRN